MNKLNCALVLFATTLCTSAMAVCPPIGNSDGSDATPTHHTITTQIRATLGKIHGLAHVIYFARCRGIDSVAIDHSCHYVLEMGRSGLHNDTDGSGVEKNYSAEIAHLIKQDITNKIGPYNTVNKEQPYDVSCKNVGRWTWPYQCTINLTVL